MKNFVLFVFLLVPSLSNGQNKNNELIGKYQNYFGSHIQINEDSTFSYSWHFDLMSSWSKGRWSIKNDTLYLKTIPIYDTLSYTDKTGKMVDSLVLSDDDKPERVTTPNFIGMLSAGGQNRQACPDKLFYDGEKLFGITKQGRLIKEKLMGFWSKQKWVPWYFKEIEK